MRMQALGNGRILEAEVQCLARDQNEITERHSTLPGARRSQLRCECGDPACTTRLTASHADYEAVRASGSQFLISLNHEDPGTSSVLRETTLFAVVDVVAGDARSIVLQRNPRHAWVETVASHQGESPEGCSP